MKRAIAVALLSLAPATSALAADLLEVYQNAVQNDPRIREANATRLATREARPQAWSQLLPQLSGAAETGRTDTEGSQLQFVSGVFTPVQSQGRTDTDGYSINLRQSVFSWANWRELARANHQVAQAEADFLAAEQDLILRVAQRYFDVLAARDEVEAQESALEAIARQLEQSERRFEVGLIAITDVQEARAARDSASAAVIAAKRRLATAEELLREITNQQYETLERPGVDMPLRTPEPADVDRWVQVSMEQNLQLISSRLAADIAREDVRIARAAYLPTLDLVASRQNTEGDGWRISGQNATRSDFAQENEVDQFELQLSVPIFTGGQTTSRARESQYRWIAARERMVRVSRETERQARDAYLGVLSEIARVNALRQALESSRTALNAAEAGYEVGTRTAVDVLDARRRLAEAQSNFSRSRYDYILNVLRLRQAAGDLDNDVLNEINALLTEETPVSP